MHLKDTGPEVRNLQIILNKLGYSVGKSPDGNFDPETETAVRSFQAGISTKEPITGIVNHATWFQLCDRINSQSQPQIVCNPNGAELRLNSQGQEVRNLQNVLLKLGYNIGSTTADGTFESGTEKAVLRFQQNNVRAYPTITPNGVADSETWKGLCSVLTRYEATPPPQLTYYVITFKQAQIFDTHSGKWGLIGQIGDKTMKARFLLY